MIETALFVALLGGGALVVKLLAGKGNDPEVDAFWRSAARRLDGELSVVPGSFMRSPRRTIRATVGDPPDGVPLTIDTFNQRNGNTSVEHTRVQCGSLPAMGRARIEVAPRSLVHKLSKHLGLGGMSTGDEAFDEACRVTTSHEALALAYLDARTRRLLMMTAEAFSLDDGILCVVREGLPQEAAPLVDMGRFAIRLTERWCELVREPSLLAAELGLECADGFVVPEEGEAIVATGLRRGRSMTLAVRAAAERLAIVVSFADTELAFDGLTPDREVVVAAVDVAVDRLGTTGAYR